MVEYERKSFLMSGPDVPNYDIVITKQQDIYDLEDCLEVLSMVVQELQVPSLKRSEISRVISIQHMAKYIYMEDSIFAGLEKLAKSAFSKELQDRLLDAAGLFNNLGNDFQEEWGPEFWEIYENMRDPKQKIEELSGISHEKVSKKLLDLQEIAISLTRISRGPESQANRNCKDLFEKVNEEAERYKAPSIQDKQDKRDCSVCYIF